MLLIRPASRSQLAYAGLLLGLPVLFWLRPVDLLYAQFFGLSPFPGAGDALANVLTTGRRCTLILIGSDVGGLYASIVVALSLSSIPMMLAQKRDALVQAKLTRRILQQFPRQTAVREMFRDTD